MINYVKLINNKIISFNDIKSLKLGSGLPFLISLKCDGIFVSGRAIMKEYGTVIIKYDDKKLCDMKYKGAGYGFINGLEKFKADIKLFKSRNSFKWLYKKEITNIEFLELMPDFHNNLLKKNRRVLRQFIDFNEDTLKLINDDNLVLIKNVYEILKN